MIGRSGSSAVSCVAASQSLRIGRWRAAGAALVDCILAILLPGGKAASLRPLAGERHGFDRLRATCRYASIAQRHMASAAPQAGSGERNGKLLQADASGADVPVAEFLHLRGDTYRRYGNAQF